MLLITHRPRKKHWHLKKNLLLTLSTFDVGKWHVHICNWKLNFKSVWMLQVLTVYLTFSCPIYKRKPSLRCWIVLFLRVGHTHLVCHLTLSHACHGNSSRTRPLTFTWPTTSWRVTSMVDYRMTLNTSALPSLVITIWPNIVNKH